MQNPPSFRPYLFSSLLFGVGGWIGLIFLLHYTLPTIWPRWGLLALLCLAGSGAALPLTYFFNLRFSHPYDHAATIREALWIGVYCATLAWLLMGRLLNFSLALWLALGILVIEYILRIREKTDEPTPLPRPSTPAAEPETRPEAAPTSPNENES